MTHKRLIERALSRFETARSAAMRSPPPEAPGRDDHRWLATACDRWELMPQKIRERSTWGALQLAVYWDQEFAIDAYPRADFPTLEALLRHFWHGDERVPARRHAAIARWYMAFRDGVDAPRERWRSFLERERYITLDDDVYVDLADVLRDTCCHWTGHWQFDGVVLDRYAGAAIDFDHYLARSFYRDDDARRFEAFREQLAAGGVDRETTWSLFSPSGERVWRLEAVLSYDGNCQRYLLASEHEMLEVRACGS